VDRRLLFTANAGGCRAGWPQNARKSTPDALLSGLLLIVSRKPRVMSPPGCGQRRERDLVRKRRNDRSVNLIGNGTATPRVTDRRSPLAANVAIRRIEAPLDVSEE